MFYRLQKGGNPFLFILPFEIFGTTFYKGCNVFLVQQVLNEFHKKMKSTFLFIVFALFITKTQITKDASIHEHDRPC